MAKAQNNPNPPLPFEHSGAQHIDTHELSSAEACVVQVIPFGDVITSCPEVPELATAQNNPNSGDQHTDVHTLFEAVCSVQVIPFGDVITLCPAGPPTAQNKPNSGDQHIEERGYADRVVQVIPFGEVIT